MIARLKLKWREGFTSPRHSYRTRTGPKCCNAWCGKQRKTVNGGEKRHKGHTVVYRPPTGG